MLFPTEIGDFLKGGFVLKKYIKKRTFLKLSIWGQFFRQKTTPPPNFSSEKSIGAVVFASNPRKNR